MTYERHQEATLASIRTVLEEMQVQPILFVGSGFSIRHFGGPTWDSLLEQAIAICPTLATPYSDYMDRFGHPIACAEYFAEEMFRWATSKRPNHFDATTYEVATSDPRHKSVFLKTQMTEVLRRALPSRENRRRVRKRAELDVLRRVQPHTVVTTNYDPFLETIFSDYTPVVGDQVLTSKDLTLGEIFYIHGNLRRPSSLVATQQDYDYFKRRRRYLVAKLLTFFVEHPLLFIGYGLNDPNIKDILRDVSELEGPAAHSASNIFIVEWAPTIDSSTDLSTEAVIEVDTHRHVRVRRIVATDFDWIYEGFAPDGPIDAFRVKPLRALMARISEIVRKDIPARRVEVDFNTLQGILDNEGQLNHILGVTQIGDGTDFNLSFRHTISDVAEIVGFSHWSKVNALLAEIESLHSADIKTSDNVYHQAVKTGRSPKSVTHKYSDAFVDLIRKAKEGEPYVLELE